MFSNNPLSGGFASTPAPSNVFGSGFGASSSQNAQQPTFSFGSSFGTPASSGQQSAFKLPSFGSNTPSSGGFSFGAPISTPSAFNASIPPFGAAAATPSMYQQFGAETSATSKYLDLKPELKKLLDDLEKTMHTNKQKMLQSSDENTQQLSECIASVNMLKLKSEALQTTFDINMQKLQQLQSEMSQKFVLMDAAATSLSAKNILAAAKSHQIIDEFFDKQVQNFVARLHRIQADLDKLQNVLKRVENPISDAEIGPAVKRTLEVHYALLLRLAAQMAEYTERVERLDVALAQLKKKMPLSTA